ncbi:uncharacterized protein SEPMUDRAFT_116533 [Sphaerulina musiva SO2202]|uniref:Uncharacterized protein n=1 Tax=Sphaerulina musiva (strain SO2202) TaxID=692275 RepID=M3CI67_SPHMS|nr:uncharacterized protein SEPMUDRAFT_116533 [Sphaerulina musiva SO2202]EMF13498.1 hypothetical protein SEPMUDRAFT_116533 [Sphaerulina musiva SO2202]
MSASTTSSGLPVLTVTVVPGVPIPSLSISNFAYSVTTLSLGFTDAVPIPTTFATSTKPSSATTSAAAAPPPPAPYSAPPPAPYSAPAPTPYSAPAPTQYSDPAPAPYGGHGPFCIKHIFGFPVIVLCSTL